MWCDINNLFIKCYTFYITRLKRDVNIVTKKLV